LFSTKEYRKFPHEKIFEKLTSFDIFYFYFPFEEGMLYNSPFRRDSTPSFNIYYSQENRQYFYKDFGLNGGDAINFVCQLFGLSYYDACKKISHDFGLDSKDYKELTGIKQEALSIPKKEHKEFIIKFLPRAFNNDELAYWNQYGISEDDLRNEEIYCASRLLINNKEQYLKKNELKFIYRFTNDGEPFKKKIYTPYSENYKWFGSVSQKQIEGLKKLPMSSNVVLIQKSRKDRICTNKVFSDVISTQNEHEKAIPLEIDEFLNKNYDAKFCIFDIDETGINANKKLNSRGYGWINLPKKYLELGAKDFSDIIKILGIKKGYKILEEELKKKQII